MNITDLLLQVEVADWIVNWGSLSMVAFKFLLDITIVCLIVKFGYLRGGSKPEFLFTYFTFNVLIFFLCYLMTQVDLSLGFAFGLFALFSIMRYRTMPIGIREMTYLFVVISLGVLNSVTGSNTPIAEVILINVAILMTVFLSERVFLSQSMQTMTIRYEKIELVNKANFPALKTDLESRLGVKILNIEILMVNYLTDSAELEVIYRSEKDIYPHGTDGKSLPQTEKKSIPEEVHS